MAVRQTRAAAHCTNLFQLEALVGGLLSHLLLQLSQSSLDGRVHVGAQLLALAVDRRPLAEARLHLVESFLLLLLRRRQSTSGHVTNNCSLTISSDVVTVNCWRPLSVTSAFHVFVEIWTSWKYLEVSYSAAVFSSDFYSSQLFDTYIHTYIHKSICIARITVK